MNTPYDPRERMAAARARLATALQAQNDQERAIVDWLCGFVDLPTGETLALLVERRIATSQRGARMEMANRTLSRWNPQESAPPTEIQAMEYLASGGDPQRLPKPLRDWGTSGAGDVIREFDQNRRKDEPEGP